MRYQLIAEEKTRHPVSRLAGVLGVSRAGFYAWEKRPVSDRRTEDEQLKVRIKEIHSASFGIYGTPASTRNFPMPTASTSVASASRA